MVAGNNAPRAAAAWAQDGRRWRKPGGGVLQEGVDGTQYWDEGRRVKVEAASARFLELLTQEWLAHGHVGGEPEV